MPEGTQQGLKTGPVLIAGGYFCKSRVTLGLSWPKIRAPQRRRGRVNALEAWGRERANASEARDKTV